MLRQFVKNKNRDISCQGFTFVKSFCDKKNYFEAVYAGDTKNWYPKSTKSQYLIPTRYRGFNKKQYFDHLTGDPNKAIGFTNGPTQGQEFYLLQFDVDFYELNEELIIAAKQLISKYIDVKHWEPSTNYKGLHGYFILNKGFRKAANVKKELQHFEKIINAAGVNIGLKAIEIKGTPTVTRYIDNIMTGVEFGSVAKVPVAANLANLMSSEPVKLSLIEQVNAESEEVGEVENKSTGMCYFGFSSVMQKIQADVLNEWGCDHHKLGRRNIYSTHMAVVFYILWFLAKKNVTQVSHALIKHHWNELKNRGLTNLSYNAEIVIWCRNYLSSKGMIKWIDNRYRPSEVNEDGEIIKMGVCCRFKLDSEIVSMLGGGNLSHIKTSHSVFQYFWSNKHQIPKISLIVGTKYDKMLLV